jgi:hypothetical protein
MVADDELKGEREGVTLSKRERERAERVEPWSRS